MDGKFLPLNQETTLPWLNDIHNLAANLLSKKYGVIPKVYADLDLPTPGGSAVWGAITGTLANQTDLNTALGTKWGKTELTNLNQLTNGPGYLTGITSGQVTGALGYTPYNSTNPSGYITGINSSMVTTALGYTPYNAGGATVWTSANFDPNSKLNTSGGSISGSLTVSANNVTGGGIILADDGDIVDLNDSYCSMRFTGGVRVFSANRGGSAAITLGSNGAVTSSGDVTSNGAVFSSNWFRCVGSNGLYSQSYGRGLWWADNGGGSYGTVCTYGSGMNGWHGYSINGRVVFMHDNSNQVGIYNDVSKFWLMLMDMSGNATFAGNVTAYSDERLKTNFKPVYLTLNQMATVKAETFTRIDTGSEQVGVRAQDLQQIIPLATQMDEKGYLSVDYGRAAMVMIANLVCEVQALRAEVEELKRK